MGLLQQACMTFDYHRDLVGVRQKVGEEPLAPCSHIIAKAGVEITIDQNGRFLKAFPVEEDDSKIIIPATEASSSRSGKNPPPHPLCDKVKYLLAENKASYQAYTSQLKAWAQSAYSHPKLAPVLRYVEGQTIRENLVTSGLISANKLNDLMVRWIVLGLGEDCSGPCWTDPSLFEAFDSYYHSLKEEEGRVLCMVTGQMTPPARSHLKGISNRYGNAKLISSNDSTNFTYRGRFTTADQAENIGYDASQKAHNALRWLVANQGFSYGGRVFVCWEPQQLALPKPSEEFDDDEEDENQEPVPELTPSQYKDRLQKTLEGWKSQLPSESSTAVIVAFDAATTGRLSLTYFNELQASDFLQRLYDWDSWCCWYRGKSGIQSPALWLIVKAAFGTDQNGRLEVDDNLLREQIQRLIVCRVNGAKLPGDLVRRFVVRASNPLAFDEKNRSMILFAACAVIRKYHYDQQKEELEMSLEAERKDRSYQYGRLLAILEKAERDTYERDEKREPYAVRMQSVFSQRPEHVSRMIWEHVKNAYYPRLVPSSRCFYEKEIMGIMEILSGFPAVELNRPLEDTYLMGYYLQRRFMYPTKEQGEEK